MSFAWLLTNVIAACLLPPLNGLLLFVFGFLVRSRYPRFGRCLIGTGFTLLFLLSLNGVAKLLLWPLEKQYPPLPIVSLAKIEADAVVVLGGGRYRSAPEFSKQDDVSHASLERLRYAALLAKTLKKPLLLSGGRPDGGGLSEAQTMQIALQRDFGVEVRWLESAADNTLESARNSRELLEPLGVRRIVLVTHAWHMPRSVEVFKNAGFEVTPAPMAFAASSPLTLLDFLPRARGMSGSAVALHEWFGLFWYGLRK